MERDNYTGLWVLGIILVLLALAAGGGWVAWNRMNEARMLERERQVMRQKLEAVVDNVPDEACAEVFTLFEVAAGPGFHDRVRVGSAPTGLIEWSGQPLTIQVSLVQ